MLILGVALAAAWTPVDGEALRYTAEWMGISAGEAVAVTHRSGAGWETTLTTRSADWLATLYPIDDEARSEWGPTGSLRYVTRFREGRFQQDQEMRFAADGIHVARRQNFAEGWRAWTNDYPALAGVEDPLSAVLRLRDAASARTLQVFSGKRVVPVVCEAVAEEAVDGVAARRFELRTREEGVLRDRITAWYSTDDAHVPLRAVVHTRAGPVTVRLVERTGG